MTETRARSSARIDGYPAAPFDALAYNGLQINGAVDVCQEFGAGNGLTLPGTGIKYAADGWGGMTFATGGTFYYQSGVGAPVAGFKNFIALTATVAPTSIGSNDYARIWVPIEGYRARRLGFGGATGSAFPVTIAFWIWSNRGGTASLCLHNNDGSRFYVTNFSVGVGGSWQFKTITIQPDLSGTWVSDIGIGMVVDIGFLCGSNYQTASPNQWNAAPFKFGTSSNTNFFQATNDAVYMTGLFVVPGIEVPSQDRFGLIMRPFDQEMTLCRRYWESSYDYGTLPGAAVNNGMSWAYITTLSGGAVPTGGVHVPFAVEKRATPSITLYSPGTANQPGKVYDFIASADVTGTVSPGPGTKGFNWYATGGVSTAWSVGAHWTADARY